MVSYTILSNHDLKLSHDENTSLSALRNMPCFSDSFTDQDILVERYLGEEKKGVLSK